VTEVDVCELEEKNSELEQVKMSVLSRRNQGFFLESLQKKQWVDF